MWREKNMKTDYGVGVDGEKLTIVVETSRKDVGKSWGF
jgi:hypothetical protein